MHRTSFFLTALGLASVGTAQTQWWVAPTGNNGNAGTQVAPFLTINHAASVAAAGDIIRLAPGTYGNEQGIVLLGTKNLSLVGAGIGVSIVKAHTSSDLTLPAGLLATPTSEAHRCAIAVNGPAKIAMRGLTLDNGFSVPATGRAYSMWVGGGADVTADTVEFVNARKNPIDGIQGPLGVNIRGDGVGDVTNVTLRNCKVHEYGKGGVVANFLAHLVMDECTVDGAGHVPLGLAAQNGIQVSRGATCELRRCTVTDHWYDPPATVATGIMLYGPGPSVVIEDCNIGNSQVGIYVFADAPASIAGTIRRNRVHTSEYGIYVSDVSGFTIADNSFAVTAPGDNDDAWDDVAGNTWSGNHYSSLAVSGPYALPGTGGASDATAQALTSGFGATLTTTLPAGLAPIDLAVANLDADGDTDFVALCQSATPALAIGINSGGTFSTSALPFGTAAASPVAVTTGEFDGAPGRDIAVLTVNAPPALTENKVWVFANNGAGVFSLLHTHTLAGAVAPSGIAAGNLDAGTVADLAVSDAGAAGLTPGSARVLLNNGTGTGFATVTLSAAYTVACRDATIGDFDGDTFADVAVTEGAAGVGRVHVFEGNGLGAFVAASGSPFAVSTNTNQALATDVELDGDVDLVVTASVDAFALGAGAVDVLVNGGGGTFTRSLYVVDRGPTAIVAGDLDDDADPDTLRNDLAVLNFASGSISVLGTWSTAGAGTGGIAVAGTVASGVGLADVNGDGVLDLLYCDAAAGTVVTRLAVVEAHADSYGSGTPGTGGIVPNLHPVGVPALPTLGNATFGFGLRHARQFSIAVIAAGINPALPNPFGIQIGDIGATWAVVTTVSGTAAVPLPVPVTPALANVSIYAQAGVFDPNGNDTIFPGFAVTNGLALRLGY